MLLKIFYQWNKLYLIAFVSLLHIECCANHNATQHTTLISEFVLQRAFVILALRNLSHLRIVILYLSYDLQFP